MDKFNILFIIREHWQAVTRSPHTGSVQPGPTLFYVGAPVALAVVWGVARAFNESLAGVLDPTAVMSAVAILIGFLLALVTWIFQLRRDYTPSEHLESTDADIPKLLDQSFYSASYGVLAAGATALIAIPTFAPSEEISPTVALGATASTVDPVAIVFEMLLVLAIAHVALTMLMLLRRLAIAYEKLSDEKDEELVELRKKRRRRSSL